MSDNYDDLIGSALGEFHTDEATSAGPITSSGAIRATVAHRRKVRITTFSVLGVLLLAAPIAAFAANPRGNNSPPIDPANSPTATVTAEPTPARTSAPITVEQLVAAKTKVDFGDYDCLDAIGAKPSRHEAKAVYVEKLIHANLDADAGLEAVAVVNCDLFENGAWQVLGFDRDDAGKIVLMGKMQNGLSEHLDVSNIEPRKGGGVLLGLATIVDSKPTIWRAYAYVWDGAKFVETTVPLQGEVTGPSLDDIVKAKLIMRSSEFACDKIVAKPKSFVDATLYVEKMFNINLDGDIDLETVAFLKCPRANGTYEWDVIALDRDSRGKAILIGGIDECQIIHYHPTDYLVTDIHASASGSLMITLRFPKQGNVEQQREYGVQMGKMVQVAGPTSPKVF